MSFGNNVTIVGNLVKPPDLRFTKTGVPVAQFSVAYNDRRWSAKDNDYEEEVHFFDVTCWQALAENVSDSLQKGDRVVVSGKLQQQTWETKEGDKRSKVNILADDVAPSLRWATVDIQKNQKNESRPSGNTRNNAPVADEDIDYNAEEEPF